MKCGMGKCEHCAIGPYHACQDEPVFSYDRIEGRTLESLEILYCRSKGIVDLRWNSIDHAVSIGLREQ